MAKIVALVISRPKLPRLHADQILIAKQPKNSGYTTKKGTLGTVTANVTTTTMFSNQLNVSKQSRTG